jgi:hypothetical protein
MLKMEEQTSDDDYVSDNDCEHNNDCESDNDPIVADNPLVDTNIDEIKFEEIPILKLTEKAKIYSQIYVITCLETGKKYVGKANSHRKNHERYRFHGHVGRFEDHISEAITNTRKTGGCRYLNNAIRKYGKEKFIVNLITNCTIDAANDLEIHYIKKYNTLSPNGYNLTTGGKETKWVAPPRKINDHGVNIAIKRGRDFGFKHKQTTIMKMKKYYEEISHEDMVKKENTMRNTMSKYYANKRAEMLANLDVEYGEDYAKYIRPKKKMGKIVGYLIRIKRRCIGEIVNKTMPLELKYHSLHNSLGQAYTIQLRKKFGI